MAKRKNELLPSSSAWTPERRARHAEAIRRWKPWEKSTGPRSAAGKARSSRNAVMSDWRRWLRQSTQQLDWEWRELEREDRQFAFIGEWVRRLQAAGLDPELYVPPKLPGRPTSPEPFPGILEKGPPGKSKPTRRASRTAPARRAH